MDRSNNTGEKVHHIHPLEDSRWSGFLERHPRSSIFHTVAWLEAVRRTYGYEAIALTTSAPGDALRNGLVFCRVNSWLTGRRLVSLPFADHCEPLVDDAVGLHSALSALEQELRRDKLAYVEIRSMRPLDDTISLSHSTYPYCFHQLDLRPKLDTLFSHFHKDSTQRKIRRAEREALTYEDDRPESLLNAFYGLLLLTRRRHQIPPQPKRWFRNLIDCFGDALKIRVAFKDSRPVAAILTLRYKDTLVYKYGCSDARFHNLGAMHLLFWRSIQEAKRDGLRELDFGRSECGNTGLITFKDRWGSVRSTLTYSRLAASVDSKGHYTAARASWKEYLVQRAVSHLPDRILISVGELLYKHIG